MYALVVSVRWRFWLCRASAAAARPRRASASGASLLPTSLHVVHLCLVVCVRVHRGAATECRDSISENQKWEKV